MLAAPDAEREVRGWEKASDHARGWIILGKEAKKETAALTHFFVSEMRRVKKEFQVIALSYRQQRRRRSVENTSLVHALCRLIFDLAGITESFQ